MPPNNSLDDLLDHWGNVRRVLVIRLDNIGDVVMTGPALRTLRAHLPAAEITLMTSRAGAQVAPLLSWVDHLLVHRALWQDLHHALPFDPAREQGLIDTLRAGCFDVAVIFTSFSQSPYPPGYACYLAGIPVRLGQAREFGGAVLSPCVTPPADDAHQVDRNLHLLQAAGLTPAGRHLELEVPAHVIADADALLNAAGIGLDQPFIALAPGASCAARRYPAARYREVIHLLARNTDLPIVLLGDEGDRERGDLAVNHPRVSSLIGRTSVPEFAAVLQRAALVVANNSAAMHIADAFARPLVVLYSGTDHKSQWAPRGAPSVLLRRKTDCAPCYRFDCAFDMECLDIPPQAVADTVIDLLARQRSAPLHPRPAADSTQGERSSCVHYGF
jgi:ADP-heptose:LPS heptosyltransferase